MKLDRTTGRPGSTETAGGAAAYAREGVSSAKAAIGGVISGVSAMARKAQTLARFGVFATGIAVASSATAGCGLKTEGTCVIACDEKDSGDGKTTGHDAGKTTGNGGHAGAGGENGAGGTGGTGGIGQGGIENGGGGTGTGGTGGNNTGGSGTGGVDAGAGGMGGFGGGPVDAGSDANVVEAGVDAGPVDAGADAAPVDSGADASPADAGADAAPVDAGADAAVGPCTLANVEASADAFDFALIRNGVPISGAAKFVKTTGFSNVHVEDHFMAEVVPSTDAGLGNYQFHFKLTGMQGNCSITITALPRPESTPQDDQWFVNLLNDPAAVTIGNQGATSFDGEFPGQGATLYQVYLH